MPSKISLCIMCREKKKLLKELYDRNYQINEGTKNKREMPKFEFKAN